MTLVSRFYDNTQGNRRYDAIAFMEYFTSLVNDGVILENENSFQVTTGNGLTLNVMPGRALFAGVLVSNSTVRNATISANTGTTIRNDRYVLRWSFSNREVTTHFKQGGAAGALPPLTRDNLIYEISLANIRVRPGATSIAAADITDTRRDASLCGIADTTFNNLSDDEISRLIETAYENFFNEIENIAQSDAGVRLAYQVSDLEQNKINSNQFASVSQDGVLGRLSYVSFVEGLSTNINPLRVYTDTSAPDFRRVTLPSGISSANSFVVPTVTKIGKFAKLSGAVRGVTSTNQIIANIPQGYRTTRPIYFVGSRAVMGLATTLDMVRYTLNDNGTLIMQNTLSGNLGPSDTSYYYFEIFYCLE